ncbi:MAG: UvrD-helicase domain-containing protein [Deltaproteobacteria bacterium]|nr:UvrD-helicase domain-containing protein [Deltaproteobacteria bacterium]MBW2533103.1 UvrD-helicase domain-containing protein [Deltaproteobacteria bacterium]
MTDQVASAEHPPAELDPLNDPQAEAVAHVEGPLIVFAGAGSGKTRVITYRIANLIAVHRVPPYRVLAVTFTNKAAGEMRERLQRLLGPDVTGDLWVGTFHATCNRLLRRHHEEAGLRKDFVIYDTSDQRAVMTRLMRDLGIDEKRNPPQKILGRIGREKQEARGPDEMQVGSYVDDLARRCFAEYQERLRAANAVDFEDLLLAVLRLAEDPDSPAGQDLRSRFSHVLVDEFQDVNLVQYRLVRAFAAHTSNICVVGDDDQSIYQWRGADVRNIRGFTRDYPAARLVKLEQNYRSSGHVVSAALGVIRPALERTPKELWTANAAGDPVTVVHAQTERDEAAFVVEGVKRTIATGISPREVAVFYRVHAQSRVLEEVMRNEAVPYQIIGGHKFFDRAEVKDLLAYLRVLVNPASDVDLLRIINNPPRKIGKKTVEALLAMARSEGCEPLDAIGPLCRSDRIGAAAKRNLGAFEEMMRGFIRQAQTAAPHELAEDVLERSGYRAALERQDSAEGDARLDNLRELLGSIAEYEEECADAGEPSSLSEYLTRVSLTADADTLEDVPRVPMMTIHAAKGLEFHTVFLTGLEERLFPLRGGEPGQDESQLEEERRLAYVAITRARTRLFLTHTAMRTIYGQTRYNTGSRFLGDLPPDDVRFAQTEAMQSDPRGAVSARSFGGARAAHFRGPAAVGLGSPARRPAAPARAPGERYVERDPDVDDDWGDDEPFVVQPGARVRHEKFGVGVVRDVQSGADPTVTVDFPGWQPKRIKLRFLSSA